jgi:hypothetical protein
VVGLPTTARGSLRIHHKMPDLSLRAREEPDHNVRGIVPASLPRGPSPGRFPDKEASLSLSMQFLSASTSYPYDPGGRNGRP